MMEAHKTQNKKEGKWMERRHGRRDKEKANEERRKERK